MAPVVALSKIQEVLQLAEQGRYTRREIASLVGVSRVSVDRIVLGDTEVRRRGRKPVPKAPEPIAYPEGPVVKCPTCGGKVKSPCLKCQLAAMGIRS